MNAKTLRNISAALILLHQGISIIHGYAHAQAQVMLSAFGQTYVLVVIILAPLVACALLYTRLKRTGALLTALSLAGSFVFGLIYHFLLPGNDNVAEVHGEWHMTFMWTAVLLAILELAGTILGFWLYNSLGRNSPSLPS
jgi:hypothetical protein